MKTSEQQAREMAERCAKAIMEPRYHYVGDDEQSYRERVNPNIPSITGDILRELNLASLLADKARLDWLEEKYHRPEFLMGLSQDARTAIDNAMKES